MGSGQDTYVNPVIKYLMFFFNFFFWLVGCGLVAIGAWAYVEKERLNVGGSAQVESIFNYIFDIAIIFMVLGIVVFILGFAGCIGSLRENVILLKFFAIVLLIIFLAEVTGAVLVFVFSDSAKKAVTEVLQDEVIRQYREDPDLQNLIDWIQKSFSCCGAGELGPKDWSKNPYFNCSSEAISPEVCSVPYSCCKMEEGDVINTMCGYKVQELSLTAMESHIYVIGCVDAVLNLAENNLYLVGGIAVGIALPQLFGIFLSCYLARQIEDTIAGWV